MTNYLIVGGVVIIAVLLIIAIIKGLFRKTMSVILSLITMLAFWYVNVFGNPLTQARNTVIKSGVEQATTVAKTKSPDIITNVKDSINSAKESITNLLPGTEKTEKKESYFVERLTGSEQSSVDENGQPVGSAKYGATFILGDLDEHGRATFAHILVSDSQEPGQNGEARPGKIFVDPAGWKNYKFKNVWVNDRTHTVGYQFGGVNSDKRVLTTAGAYLNRGTEGRGTDEQNEDSMLYYEQQLDSWLSIHPNFKLDLYVKPIYEGTSGVVKQMYMQWVGVDSDGNTIPINIAGKSKATGDYYYVILDNVFPSYKIDYQTGYVTEK